MRKRRALLRRQRLERGHELGWRALRKEALAQALHRLLLTLVQLAERADARDAGSQLIERDVIRMVMPGADSPHVSKLAKPTSAACRCRSGSSLRGSSQSMSTCGRVASPASRASSAQPPIKQGAGSSAAMRSISASCRSWSDATARVYERSRRATRRQRLQ
jgi:hypothetical protein